MTFQVTDFSRDGRLGCLQSLDSLGVELGRRALRPLGRHEVALRVEIAGR